MDTLCKPTTLISDITNSSNAPILHEAKKKEISKNFFKFLPKKIWLCH
jgi:hypothetical protein